MTARHTVEAPRKVDLDKALRELRRDPIMGPLIKRHPKPIYRRARSSFAALGRAILYQQLTGKAAGTILRRFTARFERGRFPRPAEVLALREEDFSGAGVSRQKRTYLVDLARHFDQGLLNPRRFAYQTDQELIEALTRVKGIGVWTVQMFQISTLQRPDILPTGDLGIQKGIQRAYGLKERPDPKTMEELSAAWRPWRSIACFYLWRHVDIDEP